MFGLTAFKKFLKSILVNDKNYVSREELHNLVDYVLLNQLNSQTSSTVGVISNQNLRNLFSELVQHIKPTVFCDIGSRDGESSVEVNRVLPGCACYAFEANPKIYERFQPKLKTASANVHYLNLAIGDTNQLVEIFAPKTLSKALIGEELVDVSLVEPEDTGKTSLLQRNEDIVYEKFEVQCFTLDSYFSSNDVDLMQHRFALWIDVEGAADKVLAGAEEILRQTAVIFIEVEGFEFWQQQKKCDEIARQLIKQGFIPIARDREYYDKQFNLLLLNQKYIDCVYPLLFNFKGSLGSTRVSQDIQNLEYATQNVAQNIETIQERLKTVEKFLDEYVEESLSVALQNFIEQPEELTQSKEIKLPSFVNSHVQSQIPIYIPCFNNYTYLKNMIEQLRQLKCSNIIVIDNASTYLPLIKYLKLIEHEVTVVYLPENQGPHFIFTNDLLYNLLPLHFCVTDPDLEFNSSLPPDFISRLVDLTEEFQAAKAGFSLDISDFTSMRDNEVLINGKRYKIWEWESQFWQHLIRSNVYKAEVDTTFAVYNKKYFDRSRHTSNSVRVAGDFTCRHLPWYLNNNLPKDEEEYYRKTNQYSYYLREEELKTES